MKKIIAYLLVLVMLFSLSGCGSSETETSTSGGATKKDATDSSGTSVTQSTDNTDPVQIIMRNVNNGGAEAVDNDLVYEYIKEQSGIDFEVTNMPSEDELAKKINLSLAGEEDVDAIHTSYKSASMSDLQARGALMPLKDLIEEYTPDLKDAFTEEQWKAVSDEDGEIWAVPRLQEDMGYAIAIRKDWREAVGIDKAPETIEELEEYLLAVRDVDLNGNGQQDTIPLLSVAGFNELECALGYSIMGVPVLTGRTSFSNYIDEDGNVTPIALHPRYKEYIETIARWYDLGLLHPDQYLLQKDQSQDLIIGNRVAAHAGWYSRFIRPWEKLVANEPDAEYEYITLKTYDGGDYKVTRGYAANPGMSIVSYSDNAVNTLKLFEWLVSEPANFITSRYGIQGTHWDWVDEDNLIIEDLRGGQEGVYDAAYQVMYNANHFPTIDNAGDDFVITKYAAGGQFMNEQGYVWNPDYFMFYDTKGTAFENTKTDADTYLEETTLSMILGETSVDDEWDNMIAYYRELYADAFIEYATPLYNHQMGN